MGGIVGGMLGCRVGCIVDSCGSVGTSVVAPTWGGIVREGDPVWADELLGARVAFKAVGATVSEVGLDVPGAVVAPVAFETIIVGGVVVVFDSGVSVAAVEPDRIPPLATKIAVSVD